MCAGGLYLWWATFLRVDFTARFSSFDPLAGGSSAPALPADSFCVLAIFKNEAVGMREWIDHYLWQGAGAIVLLDNGSTDDWLAAVAGTSRVTVFDAPSRYGQIQYYNAYSIYLQKIGCGFVLVADLDEFWFHRQRRLLADAFRGVFSERGVAQMICGWSMFGSSGFQAQPASIRRSFTWRAAELRDTKGVARLSATTELRIHQHAVTGTTIDCLPGFQVNHYPIQSRQWFAATKMVRGDVNMPWAEKLRDWTYFARYDFHEVWDDALANWTQAAAT
jgi:hypothetical protein